MGKPVDVHELVRQAQTGCTDAIGKLYDTYMDAVYRFVYFRINNRQDAEDITEQIFVSVFEKIHTYKEKGFPFEAWLFRIARNRVIDHYRTKKQHVPLEAVATIPDDKDGPEEVTENHLTGETVMKSLTKLPHQYQEIIILKYIEEKENTEISTILEKPVAHIRVLQSRALQALRKALGAYE